jgi:integrase
MLSEIISFGLWMRKQGYGESTIRPCIRALRAIAKRTNLLNPEAVKSYLALGLASENRKEKLADDLARFYRHRRIPFEKPTYKRMEKLLFIPLESEVDQLISCMGKKTATFLQLIKETGMRPGEAWELKWIDLDFENKCVTVSAEKNSRPRRLRISRQLVSMLQSLRQSYELILRNPRVNAQPSLDDFSRNFSAHRGKLADKNARMRRIGFKTLRHFKATMEYYRTKYMLHVMLTG